MGMKSYLTVANKTPPIIAIGLKTGKPLTILMIKPRTNTTAHCIHCTYNPAILSIERTKKRK